MKRVIVSLLITLLIFTPAAANAASPVSFRTSGCEIAGNRLFTVEVCATSDAPLCAALFEISYDTSAFEYRSSSAVKPALVEENDENGVLRLSYLNSDGGRGQNGRYHGNGQLIRQQRLKIRRRRVLKERQSFVLSRKEKLVIRCLCHRGRDRTTHGGLRRS